MSENLKNVNQDEFFQNGLFSPELAKNAGEHFITYTSNFYFGSASTNKNFWKHNGTCFFLKGKRTFGVTCSHVVEAAKNKVCGDDVVQVGNLIIDDLDKRIIAQDSKLDICTFELTENDLKKVGVNKAFLDIDSALKRNEIKPGMSFILMGYPGIYHKNKSIGNLEVGYVSVIEVIQEVGNISHTCYVIPRERDRWVSNVNEYNQDIKSFNQFGGFSGGPVLFMGKFQTKFAGIIFEDNDMMDAWRIRYADYLNNDGTLNSI